MGEKPLRLCLVRHGETDWNREQRLQGWTDVPLNAEGQAELVLGRNFRIDEELLARVAGLPGIRSAEFASTQAMLAAAA